MAYSITTYSHKEKFKEIVNLGRNKGNKYNKVYLVLVVYLFIFILIQDTFLSVLYVEGQFKSTSFSYKIIRYRSLQKYEEIFVNNGKFVNIVGNW